jgi:hypothetical protein
MPQRRSVWLFLLLGWGIWIASCSGGEESKVNQVLESRRLGMERKDVILYMSSISPQYREGERGADLLRREAMEMMRGCDSIEMKIRDREVSIQGDRAEAIQSYEIRIHRGSRVGSAQGKERIVLVKGADGWRIVSGL